MTAKKLSEMKKKPTATTTEQHLQDKGALM